MTRKGKLVVGFTAVMVLIASTAWFMLDESSLEENPKRIEPELVTLTSTTESADSKQVANEVDSDLAKESKKEKEIANILSSVSETYKCAEDLEQQYPEHALLMDRVQREIFESPEGAASSSYYYEVTKDTLKAMADTGDSEAQLVYANAIGWYAAIGIYVNDFGGTYAQPENSKEVRERHVIDMELFAESQSYFYQSALLGREGSWLSAKLMTSLMLNQMTRKNYSSKVMRDLIVDSLAHSALIKKAMSKDSALIMLMNYSDDNVETLFQVFSKSQKRANDNLSNDDLEKQWQAVLDEANEQQHLLWKQWKTDRDNLNMPHSLDRLTDAEERYLSAQSECF